VKEMTSIRKKLLLVGFFLLVLIIVAGCKKQSGEDSAADSDHASSSSHETSPSNTSDSEQLDNDSTDINVNDGDEGESSITEGIMGRVTAVRLIDPTSGWIGGKGWIARTDSGGKDWNVQYQGEQTVQQLFALNGQEAWAVFGDEVESAEQYRIERTTDGGKHWMPVSRMPNEGFLHFVSSGEAFVSNSYSNDGGKTWKTLEVPKNIVGNAYFHDMQNGWATSIENKEILVKKTTDGGQSWKTVMKREMAVSGEDVASLNGALIRSADKEDAWIELIGGSGMSQTSYSLFHTLDGGDNWQTVIANSTAGAGPAPGFPMNYNEGPKFKGSKPGPLYVVNTKVAFIGGDCPACDNPNSIGWTTDGGKTINFSKEEYPGYGGSFIAMADEKNGWWIVSDYEKPSVMYTTSNGGNNWDKVYTFDTPKE
jgi:photosystem II stability/assembly factor-like uncharacterized protein